MLLSPIRGLRLPLNTALLFLLISSHPVLCQDSTTSSPSTSTSKLSNTENAQNSKSDDQKLPKSEKRENLLEIEPILVGENAAQNDAKNDGYFAVVITAPPLKTDAPQIVFVVNAVAKDPYENGRRVDYAVLCFEGLPLLDDNQDLKACSVEQADSCPDTHWCHTGTESATYCCPRNKAGTNRCHLAPARGYGSSTITRFWYDWTSDLCRNFTYSGYGGNENHFLSESECLAKCDGQSVKAQPTQRPLANYWEKPENPVTEEPTIIDVAVQAFPDLEILLNGSDTDIKLPPNMAGRRAPDPCVMPIDQGALTTEQNTTDRWYWNENEQQCKVFTYMGSGGNQNHFLNRQQCIDTCGSGPLLATSCQEPIQEGDGFYLIPRWSFDPIMGDCVPFMYSGYGGSKNRFVTEFDCQMTCLFEAIGGPDQLTTASPYSDRSYNSNTIKKQQPSQYNTVSPCRANAAAESVTYCGSQTASQCPQNQFCQVGATQQTTVCCPSQGGNSCSQPASIGTGGQTMTRWFYNPSTGRCESFIYRGLQGNQNNYLTYDACVQRCGANPCGAGAPYQQNGQALQCSASQQANCPSNYYCHIGPDTSNSMCCPVQGNPCELPIGRGNGVAQMQRWAYNTATRQCEAFIYTGIGGNQNNFLSQNDCVSMCRVTLNPCAVGQPMTNNGVTLTCSALNPTTCQGSSYCHIGADADSTVCCPKTGTNPCHLSLATGTGNNVLPRYYFDASTSTCKAFTYTGLRGNENNFRTLAECRRQCPEYDNPCPAGNPPVNPSTGQVTYCTSSNPICQDNYWCHLGHSRQTSVCCPFPSNPCTMPKVSGTGVAQLPRYAYNQVLRICEVFTYSGKAGNQNNFQSKAECEAACPVLDNPCVQGMPATLTDGSPQLCTAISQSCPAGFWCHLGPTSQTSLCCPGAGDPCRMPYSRGNGNNVLNRWYYNTDTQTCLSFSYSGRGGNQNNFLTLQNCRTTCPEYRNPCSTGQPHIGLTGQITHCGATTPTTCPTTYWCHIGSTLDQSVCCPGAGNPCELPQSTGNGQATLIRYVYDANTQTCNQFSYTGMGGNENNFQTLNACEQRCPVFRNPCATGAPARTPATNQIVTCSVRNLNSCPSTYWCHVGSTEATTLCCPGAGTPCQQPVVVGTGDASLPRYYYNSLTQQCLPFTYSGIGGNQNNYLSRADCERSCPVFQNPCGAGDPATGSSGQYTLCSASTPNVCPAGYWCHIGDPAVNSVCCPGAENPCLLPLATGLGNAAISRWYFDNSLRRCTQFTYAGTLGNQNNFLSQQDCKLRCPEFSNPCSTGDPAQAPQGGILFCSAQAQTCPATYWCHIGGNTDATVCCPGAGDPCIQPMLPGTGSLKLNRYYFNQNTRQCIPFTYTGTGGNQNSFLSESECATRCPVFKNPCASALAPPQIVFCSAQQKTVCPAGYWCHIGVDTQSSLCCPGASDPCALPLVIGTGTGFGPINRYFFDANARLCKPFGYTGLGGNQNNFLTREECQAMCPEFVNPCVGGEPYKDVNNGGIVRFCNMNNPGDCPSGYWCHLGANQQSTVCCPGMTDPCTLQLSIGGGNANIARWYFNLQTRRCQQFTYTGLGGNQNNFITQHACQLTCPEFTNPCAEGNPLTSVSGQITYCSAQNPNICPIGYFCHVGVAQEATVCCPGAGDPCNLPLAIGRGSASLQRYYFNQLNRRCENFVYSGAGGNANNYLTLQQCRQQCPEFDNPCQGNPYRSVGGQVLYCNANSVCPPNYFCHYGADTTTTMCCPSVDNPCEQSVVVGIGRSQLTRFYYNTVLRQCTSFVYSGLGGNMNNFRTQTECEARCRPAVNPCGNANPYINPTGTPITCGTSTGVLSAVCPNQYYCHVGSSVYTTVCCPRQVAASPCALPRQSGLGADKIQRWYYDSVSQNCQMFTYNGVAGNENNFVTMSNCVNTCVRREKDLPLKNDGPPSHTEDSSSYTVPKHSALEPNTNTTGACPQGQPLMDAQTAQPIACKMQFNSLTPTCPTKNYVCHYSLSGASFCCPDPKEFCLQPRDPGSSGCRGTGELVTRFGYNPATDSCVPFKYRSCGVRSGGNLNNFESRAVCSNVCCNKGYNLLTLALMDADQSPSSTANSADQSAASLADSPTPREPPSGWMKWLEFW